MKSIGYKINSVLISILSLAEYTTGNYTSGDMDDIAVDLAGTAGVELKNYMSIIILSFALMVVMGVFSKISRMFD